MRGGGQGRSSQAHIFSEEALGASGPLVNVPLAAHLAAPVNPLDSQPDYASAPDRAGIFASTLCAVHCGLSAVVVGTTGFGSFLASEALELGFFVVAVAIAFYALLRGLLRHGSRKPLTVGLFALVPLCFARFVAWPEHTVEAALSIIGAAGLITAHTLNAIRVEPSCVC